MINVRDDVEFIDLDQDEVDRLFNEAVAAFWIERRERPAHNINVEKATALLDYIETHPDEHEQASWGTVEGQVLDYLAAGKDIDQAKALALGACGTAGCVAGWTAALDGHIVGTTGNLEGVLLDLAPIKLDPHIGLEPDYDAGYDEDAHHAEGYARDALGLSEEQAGLMFYSTSASRERIRQMFSDWTYGEIPRLRPV